VAHLQEICGITDLPAGSFQRITFCNVHIVTPSEVTKPPRRHYRPLLSFKASARNFFNPDSLKSIDCCEPDSKPDGVGFQPAGLAIGLRKLWQAGSLPHITVEVLKPAVLTS